MKGIESLEMLPGKAAQVLRQLQDFLKFPVLCVTLRPGHSSEEDQAAVACPNSFLQHPILPRKRMVATEHSLPTEVSGVVMAS